MSSGSYIGRQSRPLQIYAVIFLIVLYVPVLFIPLFMAWNPWWADLVMIAYALIANLPCILVQRFNRARMQQSLDRLS